MWRKGNPSALLVEMQIGIATKENNMEIPQKIKNETAFNPAFPLLCMYLKKKTQTLILKNICTPMFITTLFIIAMLWKQHKCPSIAEYI